MIFPYINVPPSLTSYGTELMGANPTTKKESKATRKDLATRQNSFLWTCRRQLKSNVLYERSELLLGGHVRCPICSKAVYEGSMHEVFIDRGDAMGMPFEIQMQIFVPWNVVILHEGACHLEAQHHQEGKIACAKNIMKYYPIELIYADWLFHLQDYMASSMYISIKLFMADMEIKYGGSQ